MTNTNKDYPRLINTHGNPEPYALYKYLVDSKNSTLKLCHVPRYGNWVRKLWEIYHQRKPRSKLIQNCGTERCINPTHWMEELIPNSPSVIIQETSQLDEDVEAIQYVLESGRVRTLEQLREKVPPEDIPSERFEAALLTIGDLPWK